MARAGTRRGERGVAAVLIAIVMTVLVGVMALAINAGHLLSVRGETQNAVDSAALAGTMQLNGHPSGLDPARTAAANFAGAHVTDGADRVVAGTVQLGEWHRATRTFEVVTGTDETAARRINAVRVQSSRQEPVWLATFLGRSPDAGETGVGAEGIAVGGGLSRVPCADLPFVLREGCIADNCPQPLDAPQYSGGYYYVALSSATVDTAGTTNLLPTANVSTKNICEILQNPQYCEDHREDVLGEGDVIGTANGAQWGANCGIDDDGNPVDDGKICEIIRSRVGSTAKIPVVLYPGETSTTCDGNYVRDDAVIRGFATVKIVLVQCGKRATPSYDASIADRVAEFTAPCYPPDRTGPQQEAQVCVVLEQLCNVKDESSDSPGGGWFGTGPVMPRLTH